MEPITKSNQYQLLNFFQSESGIDNYQEVTFYEMREDGSYDNGTTLEQMLSVSIERLQALNAKFPCRENSIALTNMEQALMWLNKRTEDRLARGVEGKHLA